jgi:hypothetical protein
MFSNAKSRVQSVKPTRGSSNPPWTDGRASIVLRRDAQSQPRPNSTCGNLGIY